MSLDSDPEISAAFGGPQPAAAAPAANYDPEISEALTPATQKRTKKDESEDISGADAGAAETLLHAVTGGVGALGGGLTYLGTLAATGGDTEAAKAVQEATQSALTYQPRTEQGKGASALVDQASQYTGAKEGQAAGDFVMDKTGSPGLATAVNTAANVPQFLLGALRGKGATPEGNVGTAAEAQSAMNAQASGKSMGAASTAANIMEASPELQKAIVDTTRKTGGAVNPDVLNRRLEADSLPVKMNLTEGQATQNPSIISNEMNMRGKHKELSDAYNQQNGQLIDNLKAIRESAGPDVFSTNATEHGDTLIDAYKQKAAVADADISSKYQALKDAAGGQFPIDAPKLFENASDALHKELLFDDAPKSVMSTLGRLADNNNMTFENFESLRSNLARIQRSPTADGNTKYAAGLIRDEMEKLPLAPGAAKLKPLADTARQAAKAQFGALDADPAYKAAVNGDVPPDKFVSKFITGTSSTATRDSVAQMKANLADNDRAAQTLGVAALDHLRDQAKVDSMGNGNFASASFNKHLEAMRDKLKSVVPPEQAQQLDTLGNVARYTTAQPKGSFVNNSNTLVGALASHGANALEGVANVKAGGFPVGSMVRNAFAKKAEAAAVKRALDPASGLGSLKERDQ
jgi:hypothetical protein